MTSHTPGPWFVDPDNWGDIQASGTEIGVAFYEANVGREWVIKGPITIDEETCRANARLIAAAPDLLEALSELLAEAEDIFVCMADATGIDRHRHPESFKKATAAIAKATGGNNE